MTCSAVDLGETHVLNPENAALTRRMELPGTQTNASLARTRATPSSRRASRYDRPARARNDGKVPIARDFPRLLQERWR